MYFSKILPILFVVTHCYRICYNHDYRGKRNCDDDYYIEAWERGAIQHRWLLMLLVIFFLILTLVLLGIIKGLIGFYLWAPVGMWGLGVLVDLPRPLNQYQEEEIAHRSVKYDIVGWPVHPDTGERTVRALTIKTEFCLNTVFFLTYPLAVLHSFLSLCCFKTTENGNDEDECYTTVNRIVFRECPSSHKKKNKNAGPTIDMYEDEDPAEDEDTQYVIKQMHHSCESLSKSIH